MKNNCRILLLMLCLGVVTGAGQALADSFADNFNRANVANTSNGADLKQSICSAISVCGWMEPFVKLFQ